VVATGADYGTLYPDVFLGSGLVPCKLQMMRTVPQPGGWRLGPLLATGLTLRHYPAFSMCPSLPALKRRIAGEYPELERWGIHVLVSQNGKGELLIGDSHEYGPAPSPFDRAEIDELILGYLQTFLDPPSLKIAERWHGVYVRHPERDVFIAAPDDAVRVVNGIGGGGMTTSFGLAEEVFDGWD
jgi:FAD dependent oxidoreductase TIGR03364